jgi:flagellin
MAMNDISLTAGMRSNLLSLQNTVDLLDRTQTRLATGKKVNSALDNPVSFFASQNLLNRASEIDSLKDAMGQAVQTINAADKGISAITSMIEQAKGIAQSALSANDETTASDRDTVLGTITTNFTDGATVTLGGLTFTATDTVATDNFKVGDTAAATAGNLKDAINAATFAGDYEFTAAVDDDGVLTISKYENNGGAGVEDPVDATLDDIVFTASDAGAGEFTKDLDEGATELSNLQDQYNALRTQLDALAEDSGYKGKNLLSATAASQSMTVQFEGTTLTVEGFDATTGTDGLDISAATWTQSGSIEDDLTKLDSAMDKLSSESAKLSSNLSIITVRQDFTDNMINVLTQGSDDLTLADTNEEGANMLMLQTRQSLSSTALSLSAQAAQSVLRLFG